MYAQMETKMRVGLRARIRDAGVPSPGLTDPGVYLGSPIRDPMQTLCRTRRCRTRLCPTPSSGLGLDGRTPAGCPAGFGVPLNGSLPPPGHLCPRGSDSGYGAKPEIRVSPGLPEKEALFGVETVVPRIRRVRH